ncbi:MAG: Septum formation protein Maf [Parcubacteria group bacterium GW2011_GWE2_39_37]|uniref:dTTP/UTP pyrophosphatase n=1 Tax=Candidatus Falkowbacteria bacterium GW2011_GWF2_39_8 TaxID=1618642 RepID=A0A0G0S8Y2_9BACT|nr:MAG: Septum formation protein Maf [Parcubacteria group bacterium GW2011_GWE2_39_37]KKR31205.1 MAG: Septum formation protein Maf [Candidatus Falkowbacteria bacterium GW2011_GWF2_39_8]
MINNPERKIILASGSPRRKQLLEQIGLQFEVRPSEYEEDMSLMTDPFALVKFLALKKAEDVARHYEDAIIIAADTFVIYDGKFLGKPKDKEEAKKMLETLSGQFNTIVTGFAVIDCKTGQVINEFDQAKVKMIELTGQEIDQYIATGQPLDKAGAYGVQGMGALIIERVEGDYNNILGLPLARLYSVLKEFGVRVFG